MPEQEPQREQGRTGQYGGDDGALENEREEIQPGEDPGIAGTPRGHGGKTQAERKQRGDLETGEENPG